MLRPARRPLLIACALLGATAAGAVDRGVPPPATPNGPPVDCVELSQIRETRVHGDQVIDFHMRNNVVYRNTLPYSCPELGFEEGFSYETSLSRLCSVEIITVLRRLGGIQRGASCGLGKFQPVALSAK